MDNIFGLGTTVRHGKLLNCLIRSTSELILRKEVEDFSESVSLVYYGNRKRSPQNCDLVDISIIDNMSYFREEVMNDLGIVEPDYMYFRKDNTYILNKKETRVAGYPNLIVEVWSEHNNILERHFKKYLYSTSQITEHWYIEQDSNIIECWCGGERIGDKNLTEILVSRDGVEFDLRYLAL